MVRSKREECEHSTSTVGGLRPVMPCLMREETVAGPASFATMMLGFCEYGTICRPYQFVRKLLIDALRRRPILARIGSGVSRSKPWRETLCPIIRVRRLLIVSSASRGREELDLGVLPLESGNLGMSRRRGRVTRTSVDS